MIYHQKIDTLINETAKYSARVCLSHALRERNPSRNRAVRTIYRVPQYIRVQRGILFGIGFSETRRWRSYYEYK